jgi:hypothetical protein
VRDKNLRRLLNIKLPRKIIYYPYDRVGPPANIELSVNN